MVLGGIYTQDEDYVTDKCAGDDDSFDEIYPCDEDFTNMPLWNLCSNFYGFDTKKIGSYLIVIEGYRIYYASHTIEVYEYDNTYYLSLNPGTESGHNSRICLSNNEELIQDTIKAITEWDNDFNKHLFNKLLDFENRVCDTMAEIPNMYKSHSNVKKAITIP